MSSNHKLLATSSPNAGGGSYTDVIFAQDSDGTLLMNSVILGDPCAMCIASGTPQTCDHKMDEFPVWIDPKKRTRLAKIYRAVGAEEIFLREGCAMAKRSLNTLFPRHLYADLLGSKLKTPDPSDRVSAVYVGIDPAFGGACDYALVAIGHVKEKREFQVRRGH
jgi:hypothetical protein